MKHIEALDCRVMSDANTLQQQMVMDVNAARADPLAAVHSVGLTSLNQDLPAGTISPGPKQTVKWNDPLGKAAVKYSAELMSRGQITHDLDGTTPTSRARAQRFLGEIVLENAGVSITSVSFWDPASVLHRQHLLYIAHAGHRAQLFDSRTSNIGVGVSVGYFNGSPAMISVVMFGSNPSSPPNRLFFRIDYETLSFIKVINGEETDTGSGNS